MSSDVNGMTGGRGIEVRRFSEDGGTPGDGVGEWPGPREAASHQAERVPAASWCGTEGRDGGCRARWDVNYRTLTSSAEESGD